jgi:hypothetical protein
MFTRLRHLLDQLINQPTAKPEVGASPLSVLPDPSKRRAESPVLWYRDTIRIVVYQTKVAPGPYEDMDARFYALLKRDYAQMKANLVGMLQHPTSDNQRLAYQLGVAITAVGLLTYGELEVAEDIFQALPHSPRRSLRVPPYNFILGSLSALLPVPKSIDVLADPEAAVSWLRTHQSRIRWKETSNEYLLMPEETNS